MNQLQSRGRLKVIATGSGKELANRVAVDLEDYRTKAGLMQESIIIPTREIEFGNSEIKTEISESLRGTDLYIIADCTNSVYPHPDFPFSIDQNLRALKTVASGAKESNHITAILPCFPYARQDKRISREGITAKDVIRELENVGIQQIITFDIHNPAISGFCDKATLENLLASRNLIDQFKQDYNLTNLVICSPDAGGMKRAEEYSEKLGTELASIHKKRDYTSGNVDKMVLSGDVKGKDILVIDDMAATCGTMEKALLILKEEGANSIGYAVTHAILNRDKRNAQGIPPTETGKDKILEYHNKGLLDKFYCADIINHGSFYKDNSKFITAVSMDKYIAKVIYNLNIGDSISALLDRNYVLKSEIVQKPEISQEKI